MAKVYVGVGHGGSDPGAVSGSYIESKMALDIATACTARLGDLGVQCMQSRTSDVTEMLVAKVAECNKYAPDIALDIHLNAGGGDGCEVYYGVTDAKSKRLAQCIEKAMKTTGQNSRGIKTKLNSKGKDYFGIIRQTKCPAVLVECAFIDSKDVAVVDTLPERRKMGEAVANGIAEYLGVSTTPKPSAGSQNFTAERAAGMYAHPEAAEKVGSLTAGKSYHYTSAYVGGDGVTWYLVSESGKTGWVSSASVKKCPYTEPTATKYKGCPKGDGVRWVQWHLVQSGKKLDIDGSFGGATDSAVRAFQKAEKLAVDGRVGPATRAALRKAVEV